MFVDDLLKLNVLLKLSHFSLKRFHKQKHISLNSAS